MVKLPSAIENWQILIGRACREVANSPHLKILYADWDSATFLTNCYNCCMCYISSQYAELVHAADKVQAAATVPSHADVVLTPTGVHT